MLCIRVSFRTDTKGAASGTPAAENDRLGLIGYVEELGQFRAGIDMASPRVCGLLTPTLGFANVDWPWLDAWEKS